MKNNAHKNTKAIFMSRLSWAAAALTLPFIALPAHSAGLQLMPGSPNFGTAGAGHAAIGLGAGSAWANPATMVLVKGQQVGFGVIVAQTDIEFTADDPQANSGGNAGGDIVIPSFSYVNSLNDQLSIGFSFVVPFGNSLDYDDDWAGENVAGSVSLETLQAMPSMAYRINDQFSVGFGITANQTRVEQTLTMAMGPMDADVALKADSLDYGWTIGGLYELNAKHRVGFVYRSQVDSDLTGTGTLSNLPDGTGMNGSYDTQLSWINPASIVVSGFHQVSPKVSFLWDIGRTFYAAFDETQVHVEGLMDLNLERNWKDANRFAVGTHYQLNPQITLQAGYSFDESTVDTHNRNVDIPIDDIQRYTVGALYSVTRSTELAFGIEYADLGTPSTTSESEDAFSSPDGEYNNSAVATSLSINHRF